MNIIQSLEWRYATKKFDATKKLSSEQLHTLLESLRLSPSSYGLQPWKFIVVNNPAIRSQLQLAAYNQSQVTEASHFIVLATENTLDDAMVDTYIQSVVETRGVPASALQGLRGMISNTLKSFTPEQGHAWARAQVYIALGTLLTVAAMERIDTCPMEGFDAKKYDEILGFKEKGLSSCVCVAVGFRSADDVSATHKKVRYTKHKIIEEV